MAGSVTLITPTGGRPEAFALCERWMARQTRKPDQWIVVDDCAALTETTLGQTVIRPSHRWAPNHGPTLRLNLLAAFPHVKGDRVLFIEDDDWYDAQYVEWMAEWLDKTPMVAEGNTIYYSIPTKTYRVHHNRGHGSLFQTGFHISVLEDIERIIRRCESPFVDLAIWKDIPGTILPQSIHSIGMKGMPGRPGIGGGHREHGLPLKDPDLTMLEHWIGSADLQMYRTYTKGVTW